jgi:hypothetical protein
MSTSSFCSITAWSDSLTEEEDHPTSKYVERLEAAYRRAQRIAADLPTAYDPLYLLVSDRPEGWGYLEGTLSLGRNARDRYREKLHTLSRETAFEIDLLVASDWPGWEIRLCSSCVPCWAGNRSGRPVEASAAG